MSTTAILEADTLSQMVDRIYDQSIRHVSTAARLALATRILTDILPYAVTDYSGHWTDDDIRDFSDASWDYINSVLEKDENA